MVSVARDVIDSHVLAGYDIGMDGLPGAGDELTGGDIGFFRFGGKFENSHVAIGVKPIYSRLFPVGLGEETSSGNACSGYFLGNRVQTANNGQLFGFYYDSEAGSNILGNITDDNLDDDFIIVTDFPEAPELPRS